MWWGLHEITYSHVFWKDKIKNQSEMKRVRSCPCVPCIQRCQCKLRTRAPQDTGLEKLRWWMEGVVCWEQRFPTLRVSLCSLQSGHQSRDLIPPWIRIAFYLTLDSLEIRHGNFSCSQQKGFILYDCHCSFTARSSQKALSGHLVQLRWPTSPCLSGTFLILALKSHTPENLAVWANRGSWYPWLWCPSNPGFIDLPLLELPWDIC